MTLVKIYDTTLRDGNQSEDVSFSIEDKIRITEKLDELGVHYIEGGWPSANPKDLRFFKEAKKLKLSNSQLVGFGATCRPRTSPSRDAQVKQLLMADTELFCIVGKTWDLHLKKVLGVSFEENLRMIRETIEYLTERGKGVFFDAEHFFDGFRENPSYALECLSSALEAGAKVICLCDTNGGTMPNELLFAIKEVRANFNVPLSIHSHNDAGLAVANSILAVENGVEIVQGTINGLGERAGNADLCVVIPNLQLKLGYKCLPPSSLKKLREVSHFVWELVNRSPEPHQPYVGDSAFAHKGGQHINAVLKDSRTYEHIEPEKVGNKRRTLVSEQAGTSTIAHKAKEYGVRLDRRHPVTRMVLDEVKKLEDQGYQFDAAEASFELVMNKALNRRKRYFQFKGFRVISEKRAEDPVPRVEATIMLEVGNKIEHTAAEGVGPVNALDNALRKALLRFYPSLREVRLIDYKVRVLPSGEGTASKVRVLIESTDGKDYWGTVGVSDNIIEASWQALIDSIDYKLYKDERKRKRGKRASARKGD